MSESPVHEIRVRSRPSLMVMGALIGIDVPLGAPGELWPTDELVTTARGLAEARGGQVNTQLMKATTKAALVATLGA